MFPRSKRKRPVSVNQCDWTRSFNAQGGIVTPEGYSGVAKRKVFNTHGKLYFVINILWLRRLPRDGVCDGIKRAEPENVLQKQVDGAQC